MDKNLEVKILDLRAQYLMNGILEILTEYGYVAVLEDEIFQEIRIRLANPGMK